MGRQGNKDSLLAPYRALDLTDEKGFLCGKVLADMGADVLKIERPGGDPARRIGPFYHDEPDPEKSLYWFAYNTNKRGITLDIETADGQEIFKRLVKTADFVIESFPPGYMSGLGLGYSDLEKINPRIIMVSITPFGQSGPYIEKGYQANDMIVWALGGIMFLSGDPDRPPNQISFPQAFLHGGAEGAQAAMFALYARDVIGEGQHVDISIQQCMSSINQNALQFWDMYQIKLPRGREKRGTPRPDGTILYNPSLHRSKDGWVYYILSFGALKSVAQSTAAMTKLMDEEGMAGDLVDYDWGALDYNTVTQAEMDHMWEIIEPFLAKHTKVELFQESLKRKILLAPVQDSKDIAESPQLHARDFYVKIEHPELNDTLTYCGPWVKLSETPLVRWQRAPLIGEHNREVYEDELGLTIQQILNLKQANVI